MWRTWRICRRTSRRRRPNRSSTSDGSPLGRGTEGRDQHLAARGGNRSRGASQRAGRQVAGTRGPARRDPAVRRLRELQLEAQLSPLPPVVLGGVLVVPQGLLATIRGELPGPSAQMRDTQESAARARAVIMDTERALGFEPTDRETEHLGYDIESRVPGTGRLRFIEVKGRVHDADTITVTRNEILYSLNKPDDYRLAIVEFSTETATASTTFATPSTANPTSAPTASTTRSRNCFRRLSHHTEPPWAAQRLTKRLRSSPPEVTMPLPDGREPGPLPVPRYILVSLIRPQLRCLRPARRAWAA